MNPADWKELLEGRGIDHRIVDLVIHVAEHRTVEPPTTETKQLLVAVEPDGYAAGRVGVSVLSLFFDAERARRIAERHDFAVGQRSDATWIVRIPAGDLDSPNRRELANRLFVEALDRVEPLEPWKRGLPDAKKLHGDICQVHFVQRSLTGECPMCS